MIKLVSYDICPFVQRVTATLEVIGIPYEIEYINLSNKPEWFLELSPTGQVPILITENQTVLFESDAIIEYIDEQMGALEKGLSNEVKAQDRAWSYQASKHYLSQCSAQRSATEDILNERSKKLNDAFSMVENKLHDGPYFKGSRLSKVDVAWLPLLHRASIIENVSGYDFLENYPGIKRWQTELLKTGFAEKSVSKNFVDKFIHFYLSNNMFLGKLSGQCIADETKCAQENCC